jgi:hypothetical protein
MISFIGEIYNVDFIELRVEWWLPEARRGGRRKRWENDD